MAHILFLTHVLPYPLNSGAKVRACHMLRHLALNHDLTLVSFVRPDDPHDSIDHLRSICRAVHPVPMRRSLGRNLRAVAKGLLTGQPMVIVRDEIAEMKATLRQITQQTTFDVIHADQLSMAAYGQMAARFSHPHQPRTLLDEHNAIYLLTRRIADTETGWLRKKFAAREAQAFARYEAAMCQAYDAILTVTTEDRDHLRELFPAGQRAAIAARITPIPIAVDPTQVSPIPHQSGGQPTLLHLGTMFWPPNVSGVLWFAREVLPLIHQQVPEARFVVVGKSPPPEVQALAADGRIQVTGYVADPTPYLAQADLFVVPLHAGGGMRVKILDTWLWGLPVVSTPTGAEGILIRDGENILIADDAPSFAQASLRLLTDPELNARLRANGRQWVETHYAWQAVYRQVDQVYDRLLSGSQPPDLRSPLQQEQDC